MSYTNETATLYDKLEEYKPSLKVLQNTGIVDGYECNKNKVLIICRCFKKTLQRWFTIK